MIKRRLSLNGRMTRETPVVPAAGGGAVSLGLKEEEIEWEMRPGGMLVQMRGENLDSIVPDIRVKVVYGALRYEILTNSRATFGALKKLLTANTGLQPDEQRVVFKGKERENSDYLDICGVKDHSKVILIEDPGSKEKRLIEMRRNMKIQGAYRLIDNVSMEVDKLAEQVSAIEKSIENGNKVAELQITTLIEMLMRQAVKLDSICAMGDACAKKDMQSKRVQKCVGSLDGLKVSNAKAKPMATTTKWENFNQPHLATSTTTEWELFD